MGGSGSFGRSCVLFRQKLATVKSKRRRTLCHQSDESVVLADNQDGPSMPMVVTLLTSRSWVPRHTQATCLSPSLSPVSGRFVTVQCHLRCSPLCCPKKLSRRGGCKLQSHRSLVVARSASTDLVRVCLSLQLLSAPDHALVCTFALPVLLCAVVWTLRGSGHCSSKISPQAV